MNVIPKLLLLALVLFLIAAFFPVIITSPSYEEKAKKDCCLTEIYSLKTCVLGYYEKKKEWPQQINDLFVEKIIVKEKPKDPWGQNYNYTQTEETITISSTKLSQYKDLTVTITKNDIKEERTKEMDLIKNPPSSDF